MLTQQENLERLRLLDLQKSTIRYFSQQEYDRLKYLNYKLFMDEIYFAIKNQGYTPSKKEFSEGNKRIAEFISMRIDSLNNEIWAVGYDGSEIWHNKLQEDWLFNSSWEWLMPVILKIGKEKLTYSNSSEIYSPFPLTFGMINNNTGNYLFRFHSHFLYENKELIIAAWMAVVDIIKEINTNNESGKK